jgi:ketosteroid isomerase-like protein
MKLLFTYYLLLLCCFAGSGRAQMKADSAEKGILTVLAAQQQAWNDGDIAGYMEGYWKSDSLLFTSGGKTQRGWNATLAKYKKSYDTKEKMGALDFSNLEVNLLSDSSAWVFGHWKLMRAGDHPEGLFTLIFRKFSGGWKIVHDHTSMLTASEPGEEKK